MGGRLAPATELGAPRPGHAWRAVGVPGISVRRAFGHTPAPNQENAAARADLVKKCISITFDRICRTTGCTAEWTNLYYRAESGRLWGRRPYAEPGRCWRPRSRTTGCTAEWTNLYYRAESGRLWGGVLEAPARAVLEAALQDHRLYCRVDKSLLQG